VAVHCFAEFMSRITLVDGNTMLVFTTFYPVNQIDFSLLVTCFIVEVNTAGRINIPGHGSHVTSSSSSCQDYGVVLLELRTGANLDSLGVEKMVGEI